MIFFNCSFDLYLHFADGIPVFHCNALAAAAQGQGEYRLTFQTKLK